MNTREKETFIYELIISTQAEIMTKVAQMPEDWDGIELRQYIADCFAKSTHKSASKARMKSYRNEVLVRNL